MFYWYRKNATKGLAILILMGRIGGVSKKSVSNIYSFCREVCDLELNKKQCQLGGEGKIVEVDNSNFKLREYDIGRKKEGQWVVGAVERAERTKVNRHEVHFGT